MVIDSGKTKQLNEIMRYIGEELDIPEDIFNSAKRKYSMLAEWLRADHVERFSSDAEIYPQGSFRLGTSVRPVKKDDDYDVDLVYRRDIKKESTTQEKLRDELREQLERYIKHLHVLDDSIPVLVPGRRCWTLDYSGQFHMDVLPAIPDEEAERFNNRNIEDGIKIPDHELYEWQHSNPKGYVSWFNERQEAILLERRMMMAKVADVEVESIPVERVSTPLRRIVQILKRHRDIRYLGNPDDKPISIIITTLVAGAYSREGNVYEGLMSIVPKMRDGIENRGGEWWIPNPINQGENFADKWKQGEKPQRATRFFEWLDRVEKDFAEASKQTGFNHIMKALEPVLGEGLVKRAAERYGKSIDKKHQNGNLKMAANTGLLGTVGTSVKKNTWYGA